MAFMNGLWLAYHCPPRKGHHSPPHKGRLHPLRKGTVLMFRTVQFVNRVRQSNKCPVVCQWGYFSYCTNCHICALFVNGYRLASNGHIHKWDVVAPRFLRQNGNLSLASSTGNAGTIRYIRTLPLTSGYPGQAQSCPFDNV